MECQDNTPQRDCKILTINFHGSTSETIWTIFAQGNDSIKCGGRIQFYLD